MSRTLIVADTLGVRPGHIPPGEAATDFPGDRVGLGIETGGSSAEGTGPQ